MNQTTQDRWKIALDMARRTLHRLWVETILFMPNHEILQRRLRELYQQTSGVLQMVDENPPAEGDELTSASLAFIEREMPF